MKKTFKYLMSLVAVVALSMAFTACTNEDDIDFGAEGNWSVKCTKVVAPGQSDAQIQDIVDLMNKDICLDQTLADPKEDTGDEEEEEKEPLDLTKLEGASETQALYYLQYAMEGCYQLLEGGYKDELPDGTVITFTLYRVAGTQQLVSNTASVSYKNEKVTTDQDFTISEIK